VISPVKISVKANKSAFFTPRRETLIDLQDTTLMGCKEQRPIEMIKAELKDNSEKR
jgi:hypothetical protein